LAYYIGSSRRANPNSEAVNRMTHDRVRSCVGPDSRITVEALVEGRQTVLTGLPGLPILPLLP